MTDIYDQLCVGEDVLNNLDSRSRIPEIVSLALVRNYDLNRLLPQLLCETPIRWLKLKR